MASNPRYKTLPTLLAHTDLHHYRSSVSHYIFEGLQVIGEYDGATGAVIYNFVYSGNRLLARMGSGVINWYLNDRLSTRLVLDSSGNVVGRQGHMAFGEGLGESGLQENRHFTSYQRDAESGTDYAVNRQYSNATGRFLRVDPYAGSLVCPQSLNRYTYAKNDPINSVDPTGLQEVICVPAGFISGWDGQLEMEVALTVYKCSYIPSTARRDDSEQPGTPYQIPCKSDIVSDPDRDAKLKKAVDDATTMLSKPDCAGLFQGKDAAKFLSDLVAGGFINFQNKYAKSDGKKVNCKKFKGDRTGAVTTPGFASVPGPSGPISAGLIQINATGFFVDMLDERGIPVNGRNPNTGKPYYEPFFGLSDDDVRAAALLHELLHSMYILGPDEGNQAKIDDTNRDIVSKCIK